MAFTVCCTLLLLGFIALPSHLSQHHPVRVRPFVLVVPGALEGLAGGARVESAFLSGCGGRRVSQGLRVLHQDPQRQQQQQQSEEEEVSEGSSVVACLPAAACTVFFSTRPCLPVLPACWTATIYAGAAAALCFLRHQHLPRNVLHTSTSELCPPM